MIGVDGHSDVIVFCRSTQIDYGTSKTISYETKGRKELFSK